MPNTIFIGVVGKINTQVPSTASKQLTDNSTQASVAWGLPSSSSLHIYQTHPSWSFSPVQRRLFTPQHQHIHPASQPQAGQQHSTHQV